MSDAASNQFVFEKGHDKVADVKPIETDHAVADIRHLLHAAHAVGALDPNHTTAPQDMTKVQLPHHHVDSHFAQVVERESSYRFPDTPSAASSWFKFCIVLLNTQ